MIKKRFKDRPDEEGPEQLFLKKISKIPVWNDYTPEEQKRLKEIFINRYKTS